jgi:hypothetical protein
VLADLFQQELSRPEEQVPLQLEDLDGAAVLAQVGPVRLLPVDGAVVDLTGQGVLDDLDLAVFQNE